MSDSSCQMRVNFKGTLDKAVPQASQRSKHASQALPYIPYSYSRAAISSSRNITAKACHLQSKKIQSYLWPGDRICHVSVKILELVGMIRGFTRFHMACSHHPSNRRATSWDSNSSEIAVQFWPTCKPLLARYVLLSPTEAAAFGPVQPLRY